MSEGEDSDDDVYFGALFRFWLTENAKSLAYVSLLRQII